MFSTILTLMLLTTNPLCVDSYQESVLEYNSLVYEKEKSSTSFSIEITGNIKQFFKETNKAIVNGEDLQPFIERIEKESGIPVTKENVENLPLRKTAYRVMLGQSIRAGNFEAFKELTDLCKKNESFPVAYLALIAIYDRPYEYLNYMLNSMDLKSPYPSGFWKFLMCNKIRFLWETIEAMPKGVWFYQTPLYGVDSASTYVLPFNDIRLIKKLMTESIIFMKTYGLNYENDFGQNLRIRRNDDSGFKGVVPMYSALSGILIPIIYNEKFGVAYKGANLEILKHLIEAGAKITPETLDGKSPYTLVEKSCRTPAEKKEATNYLKSIGIKDFGSKDVEQVKCETDISEKGVYIYIDDKYSSK